MLAQDAHASFVEAVRRRQIRTPGAPAAFDRAMNETLIHGPGSPVGAFPAIDLSAVQAMPKEVGDAVYDEGEAATTTGTLPAPFVEWLALVPLAHEGAEDQPAARHARWLVTMVEMRETVWCGHPHAVGPTGVLRLGGSWTLAVPNPERQTMITPHPGLPADQAQRIADLSFMWVVMGCAVLARPGAVAEPDPAAPDTPLRRSVNAGRAKGRLPPLPLVRVLDLSKARDRGLRDRVEGAGGWTVRGHDRRGHNRTLRTGRVVAVRPALVKGGALRGRITEIKL